MYQFRLSTLMIVVTVLAVFFAVPGILALSPVPWTVGSCCFGLCLWFWKFVISSKFLLSGNAGFEAVLRLVVGTIAGGALFGNGIVLLSFIVNFDDFVFLDLFFIVLLILVSSIVGAVLSGLSVFFVGLVVSPMYERFEDPAVRAACSALAGAAIGAGWIVFWHFGFDPQGSILTIVLVATAFGAIGGGAPEVFQIRADKRVVTLTESTVPRETAVEVD